MKHIEQRIEELELEVKLLKAKNKLNNTSKPCKWRFEDSTGLITEVNDYMFNPSVNLMSEPDLETAFAGPWDSSEMLKNPLDTITVNLSSITDDNFPNPDYIDSSDLPEYYPPYPDITGSYDDFDWSTAKEWASFNQTDKIPPYPGHFNTTCCSDNKNFNDVINENVTDDYGFKMNHEEPVTTWKFVSKFDKQDKNFLKYLNSTEKKIEREFGKIISKFKILTHEWDMDGYGYIVSDNNIKDDKNVLVLTNHNKPYVAELFELHAKIAEYQTIISETEEAIHLLK